MKKNLVGLTTVLLILGMAGGAGATLIGHDVINRAYLDSWSDFSVVDLSLQFIDAGEIDVWSIYARRTGNVYLQVFRNVTGDVYEVIGENYFTIGGLGINSFTVADIDRIAYEADDFIGWTFAGVATIPYSGGDGSVQWTPGPGQIAVGVGTTMTFSNGPYDRTYSVAANTTAVTTSPVPEPITILLFGTGLAGAVCTRVRRRKE